MSLQNEQLQMQPTLIADQPDEIQSRLNEDQLQEIYHWVDEVPLSRAKRNIARDFSDGVLVAEVVKHFYPRDVDLHNYSQAHSVTQKMYNWNTLNTKVLKKYQLQLSKREIEDVVNMAPDTIECILYRLKVRLDQIAQQRESSRQVRRQMVDNGQEQYEKENHQKNNMELLSQGIPIQAPKNVRGISQQQQRVVQQVKQQSAGHGAPPNTGSQLVDAELLLEKDHTITQMKETIEILELKIKKLEQLVKLKDSKIANLSGKLQSMGINQ